MNLLSQRRHHHLYLLSLLYLSTNRFSNADLTSSNAYASWKTQHGSEYENSIFLPSTTQTNEGVAIHWTIDKSNQKIQLAAATQSKGWLGFGLSEAGGMPGADVVLFSLNKNNEGILTDAHVGDGYVSPTEDTCQDWNLLRYVADDGMLLFEAERALNTKDPQDRSFQDDSDLSIPSHRVIAAWGDSESVSYHGRNTARGAIRFYGSGDTDEEVFEQVMKRDSDGVFDVMAVDYPIPATETTYAYVCLNYTDVLESGGLENNTSVNMIGFEQKIAPETKPYVHHFVLYAFDEETVAQDCSEMLGEVVYLWAPGETPFFLPSDVGFIMGPNGYKSFSLEIHYNNPTLVEGLIDNSGVRIYHSNTPRNHTAGILQIGDPIVYLEGQSVGDGLTEHKFSCPSSCTQTHFKEEVTVLREMLHMHKRGKRMVLRQLSSDGTVKRQGVAEFYDFRQNGALVVQQGPFQVRPGDGFMAICNYDADELVRFGLGSQEEMCIAFMVYYPKQSVPLGLCGIFDETDTRMDGHCMVEYEFRDIEERDLDRSFGTEVDEDTVCPLEPMAPENGDSAGSRYWDGMLISSIITVMFWMTA